MVAVTDFRTVADLARVIAHNLWRLPRGIAQVAGIPESGRLPAALIGLQAGWPVAELDALAEGHVDGPPAGPVLLVDDVARTGTAMAAARARLTERHPGLEVHRLAVFCAPGAEAAVDLAFAPAPDAALFEWSLFRSPVVDRTLFDLDGILCSECPPQDDDDGPRYRAFLETAPPQMLPRGRLLGIVTARLEKYRPETEAWLARHGVDYGRLVMLEGMTDAERRRTRPQGRFKAGVYAADRQAALFVESESWQARAIAQGVPGRAVYDYQSRAMLDAAALAERSLPRRLRRRVTSLGRRAARLAGAAG